jgi:nicotinate-nucleotide adenylyltransferase
MMVNREYYKQEVEQRVSKKRFEHSLRTANFAEKLAEIYGEEGEKAWIAGMLHDLSRELSYDALKRIAALKYTIAPWEEINPVLTHGKAAAVIAQEELGIEDTAILEAIAEHVTGQPGMSALSKIIFIADYLESGRKYLQRNSGASIVGEADLDELLLFVLKQILDHRKRKGKMIVEPALRLFDELTRNKFRLKGEYN